MRTNKYDSTGSNPEAQVCHLDEVTKDNTGTQVLKWKTKKKIWIMQEFKIRGKSILSYCGLYF